MRHISHEGLERFVVDVLTTSGVPADAAAVVADCLVAANLSGVDSHGVVRLAHYVRRLENRTINATPDVKTDQRGASMMIVDGDDGLGHVVTRRACDHAIDMAREVGSGTVFIRNSSHFGMTGYYIMHLVQQGCAGMVMTATDAFLIPHGSGAPFFGTNPLAVGFPAGSIPLILDMATTSIPWGKLALAQKEGRKIPPEWGYDEAGNPCDDPQSIRGLHPIAGPKGSGLAMVIDVFCNLFTGMAFGPQIVKMYGEMDRPRRLGHFLAAWASRLWSIWTTFAGGWTR